jgi:transcriptional regulator with PAS, ATPase and Fis domain
LFLHLLNRYSGGRSPEVDVKLIEALSVHDWPANVRELEQLSRQLLAVHGLEPVLKRSMLPDELLASLPPGRDSLPPPANREPIERRDHDLQRLTVALRQTEGSVAAAASLLGFSRQRAYRLLNGRSATALLSDSATDRRNGYSHEDA